MAVLDDQFWPVAQRFRQSKTEATFQELLNYVRGCLNGPLESRRAVIATNAVLDTLPMLRGGRFTPELVVAEIEAALAHHAKLVAEKWNLECKPRDSLTLAEADGILRRRRIANLKFLIDDCRPHVNE